MTQQYKPTQWIGGKTVGTADVMNNIEQGIESAHQMVGEVNSELAHTLNKLITDDDINIIYVDGMRGADNGDGSEKKPFRTSQKAFSFLCSLGSKLLFKQWKVKFNPGVYRSVKINSLPQFSKQLIIEGTRNGSDFLSVFEYEEGSNNYIGIWLEPMKGNSVLVKDLKFIGYKKGFNGYGVIGKNQGYLRIDECEGDNNDCCFAGVNNVTLTCTRTVVRNSSYGFKTQYNSACTIGAGTGGKHMSDGGNGCEVYNCDVGLYITRNSVSHSDYVKYNNCSTTGVWVDMNSRVATLSNIFNNCDKGVYLVGGAEWVGGIGAEIDTWNNTLIPYEISGNSRMNRVHSQHCKNEWLFVDVIETEIATNVIENTTERKEVFRSSPSANCIPNYYLDRDFVNVRVVIRGEHQCISNQNNKIGIQLRGLNDDNSSNNENITLPDTSINIESSALTGFVIEHTLKFRKNSYQRCVDLSLSNTTGGNRLTHGTFTVGTKAKTGGKKQLMVYAQPSHTSNVIKIKTIEMYITN